MNEVNLDYRLFTVNDLERWLLHNESNGLSDAVIARPRALAFIRNPHSQPDDAALSVVFDGNGNPVGYTGAFAEQWVRPDLPERYFWGSTQWMKPEYRGKGVSGRMMRLIKDAVGDRYIATESSVASCRLDEKQGSVISYYPRYFILLDVTSKGLKSRIKSYLASRSVKKVLKAFQQFTYTNRHVNWIDDATYSFIVAHSDGDLFLRRQDYLNWQLRNPFIIPTGNDCRQETEKCEFGGNVSRHQIVQIQVWVDNALAGYYVLNFVNAVCTVLYLYYDKEYRKQVFASLASVALGREGLARFRTFNKELVDFLYDSGIRNINSHDRNERVSLTVPSGFEVDPSLRLQGGDGDMVC